MLAIEGAWRKVFFPQDPMNAYLRNGQSRTSGPWPYNARIVLAFVLHSLRISGIRN